MNRARVVFAATAVCAAFVGSTVIAQQSTPQAPPMQSILAGKKFIPPVKGQAEIEYVKSPTRREGSTLVTKITVKNTMNAPIPRLKVAETWYDKQQNMLPGGEAVVSGLLQPGEVQTLEVRTPTNPNFQVQMFMFTHANGGVKPHLVKSLDEAKKEPAAKRTCRRVIGASQEESGNYNYISPFQSSGSGFTDLKISMCHLPPPHGSMTSAATTSTRISEKRRPSGSPSRW